MSHYIYRAGALGAMLWLLPQAVLAAPPNAGAVTPPATSLPQVQFLQQQQTGQNNLDSQQMRDHYEMQDERAQSMSRRRLELSALPGMQRAVDDANVIINNCNERRIAGILKGYSAAVKCSNTKMLHIFQLAFYPYMDLIEEFAKKRAVWARQTDRHEITEEQQNQLIIRNLNYITEQERARSVSTDVSAPPPY